MHPGTRAPAKRQAPHVSPVGLPTRTHRAYEAAVRWAVGTICCGPFITPRGQVNYSWMSKAARVSAERKTAPSLRCWKDRRQLAEEETSVGAPPEAAPEREGLGMQAPDHD